MPCILTSCPPLILSSFTQFSLNDPPQVSTFPGITHLFNLSSGSIGPALKRKKSNPNKSKKGFSPGLPPFLQRHLFLLLEGERRASLLKTERLTVLLGMPSIRWPNVAAFIKYQPLSVEESGFIVSQILFKIRNMLLFTVFRTWGGSRFAWEETNPSSRLPGNLLGAGPTILPGRGLGLAFGLGRHRGAAGSPRASA